MSSTDNAPKWVPAAGARFAVALLVAILAGGTLGYIVIERWSAWDAFYMTITTVTTVTMTVLTR